MLQRSKFLIAAALFAIVSPASAQESTDAWPSRPITLIVPFAAGGGNDVLGRIIAQPLSEILKQPVVIENVAGAGGMTGGNRVAKAPPDGYTAGLGTVGSHAFNQTLYKKPLYHAANDFAPVAMIADQPLLLVVRKDLPVNNLKEFIAYAKANRARCSMAPPAVGPARTRMRMRGGNRLEGETRAIVALRSTCKIDRGRLDYQCPVAAALMAHIEAIRRETLAILTKNRSRCCQALPAPMNKASRI